MFRPQDMSDAYRSFSMDAADDKPPAFKAATYLAPSGSGFLMLAIFLAASSWVCVEECVREAELYEERLLECEETCRVSGDKSDPEACKHECSKKTGFTLKKVQRRRIDCEKNCGRSPWLLKFCSTVGVLAALSVVPLLGSYKHSCRCECCIGEGCSARLALFNVAWGFYSLGCFWILPSIVEDPREIGGKVLFGMTQVVAVTAMYASRSLAEGGGREVARSAKQEQQLGAIVGAAVVGPSNLELQQQLHEINQQVQEVLHFQKMQLQLGNAVGAEVLPAGL